MFACQGLQNIDKGKRTDVCVDLKLALTLSQITLEIWRGRKCSILSFLHSFAIWFHYGLEMWKYGVVAVNLSKMEISLASLSGEI